MTFPLLHVSKSRFQPFRKGLALYETKTSVASRAEKFPRLPSGVIMICVYALHYGPADRAQPLLS